MEFFDRQHLVLEEYKSILLCPTIEDVCSKTVASVSRTKRVLRVLVAIPGTNIYQTLCFIRDINKIVKKVYSISSRKLLLCEEQEKSSRQSCCGDGKE